MRVYVSFYWTLLSFIVCFFMTAYKKIILYSIFLIDRYYVTLKILTIILRSSVITTPYNIRLRNMCIITTFFIYFPSIYLPFQLVSDSCFSSSGRYTPFINRLICIIPTLATDGELTFSFCFRFAPYREKYMPIATLGL